MKTMTHDAWLAEAMRRFGKDSMDWRFVCPVCKHVASVKNWLDAGASEGEVAFSCIGRRLGGRDAFTKGESGPCNYAGGGLFKLNPVRVEMDGRHTDVFDFADAAERP